MRQTTTTTKILRADVDLGSLVKALDFIDEEVAKAAKQQPALFLTAGIFRVQKMRKRQRREAALKLLRAQLAKKVRRELLELGTRVTDKMVEEKLTRNPDIMDATESVERAEQEEEFSKLLTESYRMRRDALKVVSELVGAEVYVSRRMEGGDTQMDEIRKQIQQKYPGRVAKEMKRKDKNR